LQEAYKSATAVAFHSI